jgi:hypothetical protein
MWVELTLRILWQAEPQQVKVSQISGAMTNLIFRCQYLPKGKVRASIVTLRLSGKQGNTRDNKLAELPASPLLKMDVLLHHKPQFYALSKVDILQFVLARIFGSSGALFERDDEQQIFAAVAHAGLGPKLLVSIDAAR